MESINQDKELVAKILDMYTRSKGLLEAIVLTDITPTIKQNLRLHEQLDSIKNTQIRLAKNVLLLIENEIEE